MYKPTTYITIEVDADHSTSDGARMLERVFGFIDPITFVAADELGLVVRLKCRNRPYWDVHDDAQNAMWGDTVGKYVKSKLDIILNVMQECNKKKYAHYEGALHFDWLKLQMEPYEICFCLDHDADDVDYLPDAYDLLCAARNAMGAAEFAAFEGDAADMRIYIPDLETINARKEARLREAEAWQAWQAALPAEPEGEAAATETSGEGAGDSMPEKPELAGDLPRSTIEFVRSDGPSLVYNIPTASWQ